MNPKAYESLASLHVDTLRREASGGQRMIRAGLQPSERGGFLRRWLDAVRSVGRGARSDAAGPGGDLRPARGAELRQDVLHVTAGGLGGDPE